VKIMSMSERTLSWVYTGSFDANGDPVSRSAGPARPADRVSHVVYVGTRSVMSMIVSEDGVVHNVLRHNVVAVKERDR